MKQQTGLSGCLISWNNAMFLPLIFSYGSDHKCYLGSLSASHEEESSLEVYQCNSFGESNMHKKVSPNQSGKVLSPWTLSFFSVRCLHIRWTISVCTDHATVDNWMSLKWNSKRLEPAPEKGGHYLYTKPFQNDGGRSGGLRDWGGDS